LYPFLDPCLSLSSFPLFSFSRISFGDSGLCLPLRRRLRGLAFGSRRCIVGPIPLSCVIQFFIPPTFFRLFGAPLPSLVRSAFPLSFRNGVCMRSGQRPFEASFILLSCLQAFSSDQSGVFEMRIRSEARLPHFFDGGVPLVTKCAAPCNFNGPRSLPFSSFVTSAPLLSFRESKSDSFLAEGFSLSIGVLPRRSSFF